MSEELGEPKETPDQLRFREFVQSEGFINKLPGAGNANGEIVKSQLLDFDAPNKFAVVQTPLGLDDCDSFRRYHYAEVHTGETEFRPIGYLETYFWNLGSPSKSFFIRKEDEPGSSKHEVTYKLGRDYERMDINLFRPSSRQDQSPNIDLSFSFVNNYLEALKYVPRDPNNQTLSGENVLTLTDKEIERLSQDGDEIAYTFDRSRYTLQAKEIDGVKKIVVSYAIDGQNQETIIVPQHLQLEDAIHDLIPQDVMKNPTTAPSAADLWMGKDIPATLFGEGWLQPA